MNDVTVNDNGVGGPGGGRGSVGAESGAVWALAGSGGVPGGVDRGGGPGGVDRGGVDRGGVPGGVDRGGLPESVVVAVDGGGTKTDVAVLDLAGRVLTRSRADAFPPHAVGKAGTARRLDEVIRALLTELGDPPVAAASVCFSDLDFDYEVKEFRAELAWRPWARELLRVDNDTFALLRAGTHEPTAVAVICGTGMNCVGRRGDEVVRFAAIGDMSGDWGGGESLGMSAIWHAARSADGRGPHTALEALVVQAMGRASMVELITAFHTGELAKHEVSVLAPVVFEAAAAGDGVAATLVYRQADEIVAFATAAITRLGVLGTPCPVVLGGGVIAAQHRVLLRGVEAGLSDRAPGAYAVVVGEPPIAGAALLAYDALGLSGEVEPVVRRSLG